MPTIDTRTGIAASYEDLWAAFAEEIEESGGELWGCHSSLALKNPSDKQALHF